MSDFGIPNTPANRALSATVHSRIRADLTHLKATATFWRLLGLGGFLLLTGLGVGAAFYGYAHITDRTAQAAKDDLAAALVTALNTVTLKTDGTVKLADTTVKLDASGASVRLDTGGAFMRPTERQLVPSAQPQSQAKTVTNFTIFKNVQFGSGIVSTGWAFHSSDDEKPSRQYCYYLIDSTDVNNVSVRYNLAVDGTPITNPRGYPINIQDALPNCVWFGG